MKELLPVWVQKGFYRRAFNYPFRHTQAENSVIKLLLIRTEKKLVDISHNARLQPQLKQSLCYVNLIYTIVF